MRRRAALGVAAAAFAAACPAAASRDGPVVSLSASPARVALVGSDRAAVTLRNFGSSPLRISAAPGSLAVDVRGRPKLLRRAGVRRSSARWLDVRPRELSISPGAAAVVRVAAQVPPRAEPGDHHAVVLFATRATRTGAVGIRMRLAVRVVVRAPGRIVRKVVVRGLHVRRVGRTRTLDVRLANRGNVTEALPRGRVTVALIVRGRVAARIRPGPRELLPGGEAIVAARYAGRLRGPLVARVEVLGAAIRTFRVRL